MKKFNSKIRMITACALGCAMLAVSGCGKDQTTVASEAGNVQQSVEKENGAKTETTVEETTQSAAQTIEKRGIVLSDQVVDAWNSMDIYELCLLDKSKIIEMFGSEYTIVDRGTEHVWMDYEFYVEGEKYPQNVSFIFNKDVPNAERPEIIDIGINRTLLTFEGINSDMEAEEAIQTLLDHGWKIDNTNEVDKAFIEYSMMLENEKGAYQCLLYESEGSLSSVSLANCRVYDDVEPEEPETEKETAEPETTVEESEPEETIEEETTVPETEKETAEPETTVEESEPEETIEKETTVPETEKVELGAALTNDDARAMLEDYFRKYYSAGNLYYCFGDITHDGIEEMFTFSNQEFYGYMDILSVVDGEVQKIFEGYNDSTTNGMYRYRYYIENGKSYMIHAGFFMRQGCPWYFYEIFHLNENGEKILLRANEYDYDKVGENVELMDQIEAEYEVYYQNSIPLLDFDNDGYVVTGEW